jgi:hypothetical protein
VKKSIDTLSSQISSGASGTVRVVSTNTVSGECHSVQTWTISSRACSSSHAAVSAAAHSFVRPDEGNRGMCRGVQLKPPEALQPSPTQPFFPPVSVPFNHSPLTPHISNTTGTNVSPRQLFNLQCCNASARGFNRREVQNTGMISIISFG